MTINWDNLVLLLIAVMQAYNTYLVHRTEKNTNSMKDALVASTAKENFAAGRDLERTKGEEKAANVALGKKE